VLAVEYLNSIAAVYVDDEQAVELRFPGGELDLSPMCRPNLLLLRGPRPENTLCFLQGVDRYG